MGLILRMRTNTGLAPDNCLPAGGETCARAGEFFPDLWLLTRRLPDRFDQRFLGQVIRVTGHTVLHYVHAQLMAVRRTILFDFGSQAFDIILRDGTDLHAQNALPGGDVIHTRSFAGHEIAQRDMWLADGDEDGRPANRYGSVLSFDVRGGAGAARRVFDALELVWRATDLGRIKSVATIPAISTHQQQGEAGRKLAQIPPNLVRLCVGAEHPDDVIADIDQALSRIGKT